MHRGKHRRMVYQRPRHMLVFDCETTTDTIQRLTCGSARLFRRSHDGARYEALAEWIFYGDDLSDQERSVLREYVDDRAPLTPQPLALLSRREFVDDVFWPWAGKAGALVVGFNLPFDISRIAVAWSEARGGRFSGGFSLTIWEYWNEATGAWNENPHRPRIRVKTIDSKRHLIGFTSRPVRDRDEVGGGHFLDARTLAFALSDKSHSLASACKAFGVEHEKMTAVRHGCIDPEYIDYNRRDVLATFELTEKLLEEFDQHPISAEYWHRRNVNPPGRTLPETQVYSAASIGKAYLRLMGITPIAERPLELPERLTRDHLLGYAMSAFYGGRAECRIRNAIVPVVYVDFLSMYPTVNALMGLWSILTAERVRIEDATDEVRAFVETATLEDCSDPATWRRLPALVQIGPQGDILPVRAAYGPNAHDWQIGVNPLYADGPFWYTLPDVLASKLLSGRAPKILRAYRISGEGQLPNLMPVKLRGEVEVDPRATDFFRAVIEERARVRSESRGSWLEQALKVIANSTGYGIFAEMQRRELPGRQRATVTVFGVSESIEAETPAPEEPGEYSFPPIAACITGAAKLMLAMLERSVSNLGGTYAMCDTDSMAIVATREAGPVPCGDAAVLALSWDQVEAIRTRFDCLNPYHPSARAGSLLKLEALNFDPDTEERLQLYGYAISAKRYTLFNVEDQDS